MALQLDHITFFYPEDKHHKVLDINHWSVNPGKKHFIYGPSGSGKSTLLNLIGGLLLPNTGSIKVLGESLEKMTNAQRDRFRANNIGFIFQQFNLIPYLTAIENIKLAHHFAHHSFAKHKKTQLLANIKRLLTLLALPEHTWYRPVNQLSIGQQQRIGIARAFINQPKLLIADEPTSSLDACAKDKFISLLSQLCQTYNSTLLFVSHDIELKVHFDTVQALADFNHASFNHAGNQ